MRELPRADEELHGGAREARSQLPRAAPDLTAKIGAPNACSGCHAEKGTEWAVEAAAKWWGTAKSSLPHYGEVIDAGRKRKAGAGAGLVKLIGDATQPAIVRASAVELLAENAASAGDVVAALEGAAKDADPQVRAAAAREMARIGEAAIVVRVLCAAAGRSRAAGADGCGAGDGEGAR